jgi:hypothetical protein
MADDRTGAVVMAINLEQRVAALEKQIASLQQQGLTQSAGRAWLGDLYGKFTDDPMFEQAMKLGRKYRRSLRPGVRKAKPKR